MLCKHDNGLLRIQPQSLFQYMFFNAGSILYTESQRTIKYKSQANLHPGKLFPPNILQVKPLWNTLYSKVLYLFYHTSTTYITNDNKDINMCHLIHINNVCARCGRWLSGEWDIRRCREARSRSRDVNDRCPDDQCVESEMTKRLAWTYCWACVEEYNEWLRRRALQ